MDICELGELTVNQPVTAGGAAGADKAVSRGDEVDVEDQRLRKIARDFESIFIHQILKSMKDTIPESSLGDSSSKQIQGMYWSFLADTVADKGGFGLWKKIYELMPKDGLANGDEPGTAVMQLSQEVESQVDIPRVDESI